MQRALQDRGVRWKICFHFGREQLAGMFLLRLYHTLTALAARCLEPIICRAQLPPRVGAPAASRDGGGGAGGDAQVAGGQGGGSVLPLIASVVMVVVVVSKEMSKWLESMEGASGDCDVPWCIQGW